MADLTASLEELIATFRELFPHEFQIAFLTLANKKRAEGIAGLEREMMCRGWVR